jgi:hypothetical protein
LISADQADALKKAAELKTDAFAKADVPLDALFGAAPVTLSDNPTAALPVVHGRLTVERGERVQRGEQGYREWPDLKLSLKTEDGRTFALESDNNNRNDIFQFVPGTDVMAFAGQDVSLRGFIDEAGGALRVTEFAPGRMEDFVSGRVAVSGDDVFVRARGRGNVAITDPALKAELRQHNNLGVIIEGKTEGRLLAGAPKEYWMLVKFTQAPTPGAGGKLSGPIEAATSTTRTTVELDADQAKNVEVGDRMYVLGRFDESVVRASKAMTSAGSPWTTASTGRAGGMRSVIEFTDAEVPL